MQRGVIMDINKIIESLGDKREEIVKKAAVCKNVEELLTLANEYNIKLDAASAAVIFEAMQPKPGALADDELDAVAGGAGVPAGKYQCRVCNCEFWLTTQSTCAAGTCPRGHTNIVKI